MASRGASVVVVRSLVLTSLVVAVVVAAGRADAEPPAPLASAPVGDEAWVTPCARSLDDAARELGRRHRAFRRLTATVVPRVPPPRVTVSRTGRPLKPVPVRVRHAPLVSWSLQYLGVPEYFYVDVLDLRDDERGWAEVAGDGAWACSTRTLGDQVDRDCAQRRGGRLAVVRAIYWGRSPRAADYEAAFTRASARCLE